MTMPEASLRAIKESLVQLSVTLGRMADRQDQMLVDLKKRTAAWASPATTTPTLQPGRVLEHHTSKPSSPLLFSSIRVGGVGAPRADAVLSPTMLTSCLTNGLDVNGGSNHAAVGFPSCGNTEAVFLTPLEPSLDKLLQPCDTIKFDTLSPANSDHAKPAGCLMQVRAAPSISVGNNTLQGLVGSGANTSAWCSTHILSCADERGACAREIDIDLSVEVLTHVGGLSLFSELDVDSAQEVVKDSPLKDMVWYEELADSPLNHIGGLSLFRELVLAGTQPWCRSAFIPGFKKQRHRMYIFSDSGQRSLQTISNCDNLASPLDLQKRKSDEELCEQWDPGILVEKVFRLSVREIDTTKRLFLCRKIQILEAIGSEQLAQWPSCRCYWYGEPLGFHSNESIHALGDARKGTYDAPWLLSWSWYFCFLTGGRLKQPTTEMRNVSKEQLVEVLCSIIFPSILMESVQYSSITVLELFSCNIWCVQEVLFSKTYLQQVLWNNEFADHMLTEIGGLLVFNVSDLDRKLQYSPWNLGVHDQMIRHVQRELCKCYYFVSLVHMANHLQYKQWDPGVMWVLGAEVKLCLTQPRGTTDRISWLRRRFLYRSWSCSLLQPKRHCLGASNVSSGR